MVVNTTESVCFFALQQYHCAMRHQHRFGARDAISSMGSALQKGQRLRPLRPAHAEREWGVSGDAVGTVLCCYRLNRAGSGDRVDVRFNSGATVWGAPATEFQIVGDSKSNAS